MDNLIIKPCSILLYCDGVELTLEGNDAREFEGTKKGRIYLTTHRMIFVNKSEKDHLQSFSFPFLNMQKVDLEQPVFGANFIKGDVVAERGGNWSGRAGFKLKFFTGGSIEFGQAMLRAAQMAHQNRPSQPPPYMPHHRGPYYPAPPPAYFPPTGGINGFVPPTHVFPNNPPANSVYTSDMPPPYPGIFPSPYAQPPTYPSNYPQTYPQPPQSGPGGPPPPGFNQPGFAGPGVGATAPPAYESHAQAPQGAQAQFNGTATQQGPGAESKAGILFEFHQHPYDSAMYGPTDIPYMNGQQINLCKLISINTRKCIHTKWVPLTTKRTQSLSEGGNSQKGKRNELLSRYAFIPLVTRRRNNPSSSTQKIGKNCCLLFKRTLICIKTDQDLENIKNNKKEPTDEHIMPMEIENTNRNSLNLDEQSRIDSKSISSDYDYRDITFKFSTPIYPPFNFEPIQINQTAIKRPVPFCSGSLYWLNQKSSTVRDTFGEGFDLLTYRKRLHILDSKRKINKFSRPFNFSLLYFSPFKVGLTQVGHPAH